MAEFDLVIHDGLVVDGSGKPPYPADVGVVDGRIASIGKITARGRQDIEAEGRVISPGFIDGHTHMDAQMFWERIGRSSCYHGVTSAVIGNCGFTLAPSRADGRALVVRNLEKAEQIPPAAMALGIPWGWETFREYLDVIERLPKGINYAAQIGHSALRTWAMGERAFDEQATEEDFQVMEAQLRDALSAGAIGFTTSRSDLHLTSDGRRVASNIASWEEVATLVRVLRDYPGSVYQFAPPVLTSDDPEGHEAARDHVRKVAVGSGVPTVMGLNQAFYAEGSDLLEFMSSVDAGGGKMIGLSHPYGLTIIYSFKTNLPFDRLEGWKRIRELPLSEQERLLRDPEVRARLVKEANEGWKSSEFSNLIYEENPLPPNRSLAEIAKSRGVDPVEALIDLSLETDFNAMFKHILHKYDDEYLLAAMRYPHSAMTFSDSGAHVGSICDFNIQTYFLAYWVRERKEFALEEAIRLITSAPAEIWSLPGRGLVREGYIADLNVFDPDEIAPIRATAERDFPGGVVHLQQKAVGIEATVVAGEVTMRQGEPTGVLSGQLIRRGSGTN